MWLNAALAPAPPGGPGGADGETAGTDLAAKRLEARVRGVLWHLYCGDPDLIHVMTRIEKRIDEGYLRLKPEVRHLFARPWYMLIHDDSCQRQGASAGKLQVKATTKPIP